MKYIIHASFSINPNFNHIYGSLLINLFEAFHKPSSPALAACKRLV